MGEGPRQGSFDPIIVASGEGTLGGGSTFCAASPFRGHPPEDLAARRSVHFVDRPPWCRATSPEKPRPWPLGRDAASAVARSSGVAAAWSAVDLRAVGRLPVKGGRAAQRGAAADLAAVEAASGGGLAPRFQGLFGDLLPDSASFACVRPSGRISGQGSCSKNRPCAHQGAFRQQPGGAQVRAPTLGGGEVLEELTWFEQVGSSGAGESDAGARARRCCAGCSRRPDETARGVADAGSASRPQEGSAVFLVETTHRVPSGRDVVSGGGVGLEATASAAGYRLATDVGAALLLPATRRRLLRGSRARRRIVDGLLPLEARRSVLGRLLSGRRLRARELRVDPGGGTAAAGGGRASGASFAVAVVELCWRPRWALLSETRSRGLATRGVGFACPCWIG